MPTLRRTRLGILPLLVPALLLPACSPAGKGAGSAPAEPADPAGLAPLPQ